MSTTDQPSFGDRVANPDASESNPHKYGYFVEVIHRTGRCNKGTWYRCTDGRSNFWESKRVEVIDLTPEELSVDEYRRQIGDPRNS